MKLRFQHNPQQYSIPCPAVSGWYFTDGTRICPCFSNRFCNADFSFLKSEQLLRVESIQVLGLNSRFPIMHFNFSLALILRCIAFSSSSRIHDPILKKFFITFGKCVQEYVDLRTHNHSSVESGTHQLDSTSFRHWLLFVHFLQGNDLWISTLCCDRSLEIFRHVLAYIVDFGISSSLEML
jgi:hypothetical protein